MDFTDISDVKNICFNDGKQRCPIRGFMLLSAK